MKKFLSLLLVFAVVAAMVCAFAVNVSADETSAEEEAPTVIEPEDGVIYIVNAGNYIFKEGTYTVSNFILGDAKSHDIVLTIPKDAVITVETVFNTKGTIYVYGTLIVKPTNANNAGTIHICCDGKFDGDGMIFGTGKTVRDGHDFGTDGLCKHCGKPDGTILSGDVWYKLTENSTGKTLTIGGEGDMPDFMFSDETPWYDVAGKITAIKINSGVTSIGGNAFSECKSLKELTIPGSVERIGSSAFANCTGIATLTISEGVTSIGDNAFRGCTSLKEVKIPGSVEWIADSAFSDCIGIATLTISEGVQSIGTGAFNGCSSLQEVTIPGTVTSIGTNAFSACWNLKKVTIPASVTSIETNAFVDCDPGLAICGQYESFAETYARNNRIPFEGSGVCNHIFSCVCDSCKKSLTKSELLKAWGENNLSGSTISGGSLTIICSVVAAVVFGLGGFLLGRKKKPALAGENREE